MEDDFDNYKDQKLEGKELPHKRWIACLDNYLYNKKITADDYTDMSIQQRIIINEIKKSFNRNKKPVWKE